MGPAFKLSNYDLRIEGLTAPGQHLVPLPRFSENVEESAFGFSGDLSWSGTRLIALVPGADSLTTGVDRPADGWEAAQAVCMPLELSLMRFGGSTPSADDRQLLELRQESFDGLSYKNVSRLLRMVRDWRAESVAAAGPAIAWNHWGLSQSLLQIALSKSQHPLLERHGRSRLPEWLRWWRSLALLGLRRGVAATSLVSLLRDLSKAMRRWVQSVPPAPPRGILTLLQRLLGSLDRHAPPLSASYRISIGGAG
jgi:hypothetical protein